MSWLKKKPKRVQPGVLSRLHTLEYELGQEAQLNSRLRGDLARARRRGDVNAIADIEGALHRAKKRRGLVRAEIAVERAKGAG